MGQLEILRVLKEAPLTANYIKMTVGSTSSTVHHGLRRLMKYDLIKIVRQPLIVYVITEKGKDYLNEI